MKRRAAPTEAAKFSLFPFLAVLLCVMGALVVLLVVIAQRSHDRGVAAIQSLQDDERLKEQQEELVWRIDMIHQSRDATAAQLAEQRAGLSHIEDHARRLREQYRALERAAKDLEQTAAVPSAESQAADAELARIQARLRAASAELDAKRLAPRPVAGYAIIPYEGPNGTQRRPMYIECTDAGIILQPEGVVLTADDFLGPLGPGNPLAASMRAAREYLLRNRGNDGREPGEPYPLLLIRPDGIGAYYVARAALTSWGSEFGYEFVDQDWKLEYPAVDPELLAITKVAAEDARDRQRMLARAAPKVFQGAEDSEIVYRASPTTGGVMVDGRAARRGSSVQRRSGRGAAGGQGEDVLLDSSAGPRSSGGFARSGTSSADTEAGQSGGAAAQGDVSKPGRRRSSPVDPRTADPSVDQRRDDGGESLHLGQYVPKQSLAAQRGRDWAVREKGPAAVPISRKIRIRCEADQLTILSDGDEQAIALGPRAEDSIEELVSKVWTHMDRWGIAGRNMYWKPQLLFETTPDSQARFEEIKSLLEGSGLECAEKPKPKTARGKDKTPR